MHKVFLLIVFVSASIAGVAQTGSISGAIKDAGTSDPIIGANVIIQGTQLGTSTDIEGNFIINNLKPGTYNLTISFVTYKTFTLENIVVEANKKTSVSASLSEEAKELEEVVVKGRADRTSEATLLGDRKLSVEMVQGIGAQELSRKGVSDAEGAIVQITGITKQEGVKNVFVRGLGDRYNSTSLNGLPLPSEDPRNKNITLDLFSADIINSVDVNKTFNADMFGDVGGANIDIKTKQLFDDQELKVTISGGANSQTAGKDFYRADGTNFLGTVSRTIPITNLTQYDFEDSYQPNKVSVPMMNSGFSISGGKSFMIGNRPLRTFVVGSLNSEYFINEVVERQESEGGIAKDLKSDKFEYNASQLAMGNFSYELSENATISYNLIYIHDNKQSVASYTGFNNKGNDDISDPNAYKTFIRRQQQNNNTTLVNQLLSEIKLNEKMSLDLGGSYNTARGDEPDRRTNFYVFDGVDYRINTGSSQYNHRFFSSLKENDIAGRAVLAYDFNDHSNTKISVGYNVRSTHRDFESTQFNFDFISPEIVDVNNPDALFNQQSIDNGVFDMETSRGSNGTALDPFTYMGDRVIHAAFVNAIIDLSSVFTVNIGMRAEKFTQEIVWETNISDGKSKRAENYFLPSLNAKYDLTENDILRFASSKTYTFAQFKELAPFLYEDVNSSELGNPNIKPSENLNVDIRYEHYFNSNELVALTGFYKSIKYPINRGLIASAANEFSYFNSSSDAADIFGGELELRKTIFNKSKGSRSTTLDFGVNVSYLYSKQKLEDVSWDDPYAFPHTNPESKLEGASTWLANSDVTVTKIGPKQTKLVATVVLNYNTARIYSLGAPGNGDGTGNQDIDELAIPKLDFISSYDFNEHFSVGLKVKNLLNPNFRKTKQIGTGEQQYDAIISNYQKGITTTLGLTYKL